jgi:simple sugar transport system substrate-binding protein
MAGVVAGGMTKSNVLGVVGSIPIPEVIRNIDSYTLGAQSVNPKVKVRVVWVNEWFNPPKETEGAQSLIDGGADVLLQNTDSSAVLQTAEKNGKYAFGWDSDMARFAPKAHLTATTNSWGDFYTRTAQAVIAGTWKSAEVHGGLMEGMVKMSPLNAVIPADTAKLFETKKAAIIGGKLKPFQGPLKDQSGAVKVAAGSEMSLADLKGMNWYVQGVEGTIPK